MKTKSNQISVNHININTGHCHNATVDCPPPLHSIIAAVVRGAEIPFIGGHLQVMNPEMPGYAWAIHTPAVVTCVVSEHPNPALFGTAVELARSIAEKVSDRDWLDVLMPHPVISEPPAPWLATILHIPMFGLGDRVSILADFNQCVAACLIACAQQTTGNGQATNTPTRS